MVLEQSWNGNPGIGMVLWNGTPGTGMVPECYARRWDRWNEVLEWTWNGTPGTGLALEWYWTVLSEMVIYVLE